MTRESEGSEVLRRPCCLEDLTDKHGRSITVNQVKDTIYYSCPYAQGKCHILCGVGWMHLHP